MDLVLDQQSVDDHEMVRVPGGSEMLGAPIDEVDRWLRSPDQGQVMRIHRPADDDGSSLAQMEIRSVMGGLPIVRRLTAAAAMSAWNHCRQNGWTRCHPQW